MSKQEDLNEHEEDQVVYCAKCYSLKIKYEDLIGIDCCGDCGCTDIKTTSFDDWEKLYKSRYGHKFVEEKGDIRKSPMFQFSIDQLKERVYSSPFWKQICLELCPDIPHWLGKADIIILMFAKLYQENRLDDLRMKLINISNKNKTKNYGREEEC